MPKNPYSGGIFQSALSERELFVGREEELQALQGFVAGICSGSAKAWVIHVFGAAGTGKSSLLARLRADNAATEGLHSALLDIDADSFDISTSAPDLLWQLRFSLRRAGVKTPLYDLYYATYFTRHVLPGVTLSLSTLLQGIGAKTETMEKASSIASSRTLGEQLTQAFDAEFLEDIVGGAGEFAKSLQGVQLIAKLASAFRNKATRRALKDQRIDLSSIDREEMQSLAPEILASDLLRLASKTNPILILVDGFDRIQIEPQVLPFPGAAESAMEELVRFVKFSSRSEAKKHIAFLCFGRKHLRWAELFDEVGSADSWDEHIHQLPLRGLSQAEAEVYLAKADGALDAVGGGVGAQALRSSKQAILTVSRDQVATSYSPETGEAGASTEAPDMMAGLQRHGEMRYSPFRLRLCMEEIAEIERPFSNDDARRHADDICASFLRGVSEPLREVVNVFALAGEVDASMYEALVKEGVISNFTIAEFPLLVRRGALFAPAVSSDAYRLHFQLEDAALTLLAQNKDSRDFAEKVVAEIHDQYLQRSIPKDPKDPKDPKVKDYAMLTKANLDAHQQAMRLAFRVYEAGLLPIDTFATSFLDLEEALEFDMQVGSSLRTSWLLRLFEISARWDVEDGEQLVKSQRQTQHGKLRARQIFKLMECVFYANWMSDEARDAAKSMFTRMYREGVLPPTDCAPDDSYTEAILVNYTTELAVMKAKTTSKKFAEGCEFEEAEAVLWECMRSLPATLLAEDRARHEGDLYLKLAQVAIGKNDKVRAEAQLERALSSWRDANPDPTVWAGKALKYCMAMLFVVGKEEPAATLFREIAPGLEAELPAMHPTRADLANTFAVLCQYRGYSALALPYFQTAKEVLIANYGENDQRVRGQQSLIDDIQSRM